MDHTESLKKVNFEAGMSWSTALPLCHYYSTPGLQSYMRLLESKPHGILAFLNGLDSQPTSGPTSTQRGWI